jgi:hypothetical protein
MTVPGFVFLDVEKGQFKQIKSPVKVGNHIGLRWHLFDVLLVTVDPRPHFQTIFLDGLRHINV